MTICTILTEPLANLQIEITAYNNKKIKVSTINQNFKMEQVHGGVNTGKEDRYVLLVTVELDQQFIDKYKKNVPVYKYEC
jgi:hypothetical protein